MNNNHTRTVLFCWKKHVGKKKKENIKLQNKKE